MQSELHMAGYADERLPQMQRRMLDAAAAIPGVTAAGLCQPSAAEPGRWRLVCLHRHHHRLPADQLWPPTP